MRYSAERGSRLAQLRIEAHHAFDVHWEFAGNRRARVQARTRAYAWLARQLGIPVAACHFGMFDEEACLRAIQVCRSSHPTQ